MSITDVLRHLHTQSHSLKERGSRFGNARSITKETIFYYVYGILHSLAYRRRFNDDLKKELPHIPIVPKVEDFIDFAQVDKRLGDLHCNYVTAPPWPEVVVTGTEKGNFRIEKMRFPGKQGEWDKLSNIPLCAYEYVVNGRSAIEWIVESYRVKTDTDSSITNDPNAWASEHDQPRYILDFLLSVIGLSMKTLEIVDRLPRLELGDAGGSGGRGINFHP